MAAGRFKEMRTSALGKGILRFSICRYLILSNILQSNSEKLLLTNEEFCDICILLGSEHLTFNRGIKPIELLDLIKYKSLYVTVRYLDTVEFILAFIKARERRDNVLHQNLSLYQILSRALINVRINLLFFFFNCISDTLSNNASIS